MPDKQIIETQSPRVLVVDDEVTNRILLRHMLKPLNCVVEEAESAHQGMEIAATFKPHLFLLDVMMPKTTGFEMCKQLKQKPEFAKTPIIFITALSDVQEKVKGFSVGGADYICKPFQKEEVLARIRLQLDLLAQREALQRYAENLEDMVQTRTRQLVHADRLVTIGTMAAKILHEINNPLSLVTGNVQIIQETWEQMAASLRPTVPDVASFEDSSMLMQDCLKDAAEGARRIARLADGIRQYSRKNETRTIKRHPLKAVVEEAARLMHPRLKHQYSVNVNIPEDILIDCDADRLQQVFMNLMANSADAVAKGTFSFSASAEPDSVLLIYEDNGPGIPEDLRDKIFESFFTTKGPGKGTGIGMTIVQEILREHGGEIALAEPKDSGARFEIRLNPEGKPKPNQNPAGSKQGGAA